MVDVIKRLKYYNGQFLQQQDFTAEQEYHLDRQRRHNRQLHTPGIADGLAVTVGTTSVSVAPGTAIDGDGRQIVLHEPRTVGFASSLNGQSALVVISYTQEEADDATVGDAGKTRWKEVPLVEAIPESGAPSPSDRIPLARLQISSTGTVAQQDLTVRIPTGARLRPEEAFERLRLSRQGVSQSQWPVLSSGAPGQADVTGNLSVSGTISGQLATDIVGNAQIAANAVTTAKIADLAVTTPKIANLAVATAKIADLAVTTPKIADLGVTAGKLADLGVTTGKIADLGVTAGKIADLAVTTGKLADLGVTTAKIANLGVTAGKIADLGVTTGKIADLGVTTGKLADLAVTTPKIADLGVTTPKLADLGVTAAKIADSTIPEGKLDAAARGKLTDALPRTGGGTVTGNLAVTGNLDVTGLINGFAGASRFTHNFSFSGVTSADGATSVATPGFRARMILVHGSAYGQFDPAGTFNFQYGGLISGIALIGVNGAIDSQSCSGPEILRYTTGNFQFDSRTFTNAIAGAYFVRYYDQPQGTVYRSVQMTVFVQAVTATQVTFQLSRTFPVTPIPPESNITVNATIFG